MLKVAISKLAWAWLICLSISVTIGTAYAQQSDLKILNDQALSLPAPSFNGLEHSWAGKVTVHIKVDENGRVIYAKALPGEPGRPYLLTYFSENAAKKAVFPKKSLEGVLVYNFPIPTDTANSSQAPVVKSTPAAVVEKSITDSYFTEVNNIVVFADVKETDFFYQDLKALASSRIAFGYSDKKFHGEMFLTRGDLAYFLGKAMEELKGQASFIKVDLQKFYRPYRELAYRGKPISDITDLKPGQPYYPQVVNLANNYKIYLFDYDSNEPMSFHGTNSITHRDVKALFAHIFRGYGSDFNSTITDKIPNDDELMKRGQFSLYLNQFLKYMTKAFVLESISQSKTTQ